MPNEEFKTKNAESHGLRQDLKENDLPTGKTVFEFMLHLWSTSFWHLRPLIKRMRLDRQWFVIRVCAERMSCHTKGPTQESTWDCYHTWKVLRIDDKVAPTFSSITANSWAYSWDFNWAAPATMDCKHRWWQSCMKCRPFLKQCRMFFMLFSDPWVQLFHQLPACSNLGSRHSRCGAFHCTSANVAHLKYLDSALNFLYSIATIDVANGHRFGISTVLLIREVTILLYRKASQIEGSTSAQTIKSSWGGWKLSLSRTSSPSKEKRNQLTRTLRWGFPPQRGGHWCCRLQVDSWLGGLNPEATGIPGEKKRSILH